MSEEQVTHRIPEGSELRQVTARSLGQWKPRALERDPGRQIRLVGQQIKLRGPGDPDRIRNVHRKWESP